MLTTVECSMPPPKMGTSAKLARSQRNGPKLLEKKSRAAGTSR